MAMQVETSNNIILPCIALDFVLDIDELWVENFRRVLPPSIHVHACDVATAVSVDYSVDVDHWKNHDGIVFEQVLDSFFVFFLFLVLSLTAKGRKLIQNTFHKERRDSFPRVLTGHKNDHLLVFCRLFLILAGRLRLSNLNLLLIWSNLDFWQIISTKRPPQPGGFQVSNFLLRTRYIELLAESLKIVGESREGIRKIGGNENIIIVITKFKAECEFIELEELGSGDVGLLIFNVVTPAVPAVLIVVFLMLF